VIGILGVALAALRNPSYLWANAAFTAALMGVVAAVVNSIVGRGARRAYWLGFALFGGTYLAICSTPVLRDSVCPHLVTEAIFDMVYPLMAPASPQLPPAPVLITGTLSFTTDTMTLTSVPATPPPQPLRQSPSEIGNSNPSIPTFDVPPAPVTTFIQTQPPPPPSPWSAWTAPDRSIGVGYALGSINLVSSEAFRQIGHSFMALLVATLGGVFARYRHYVCACDREPAAPALS
jgi:hypothetical protein